MSEVTRNTPRHGLEADLEALDWRRAHSASIQMRYGDLDTMGHLNNSVYVQYLETSRVLLSRDLGVSNGGGGLGGDDDRTVIAHLELDYRHEIRFGQDVQVQTMIERVGRTSWTLVSRMLADGKPCAYARTVQVRVDQDLRPTPVSAQHRRLFEQVMVTQPEHT